MVALVGEAGVVAEPVGVRQAQAAAVRPLRVGVPHVLHHHLRAVRHVEQERRRHQGHLAAVHCVHPARQFAPRARPAHVLERDAPAHLALRAPAGGKRRCRQRGEDTHPTPATVSQMSSGPAATGSARRGEFEQAGERRVHAEVGRPAEAVANARQRGRATAHAAEPPFGTVLQFARIGQKT